MPPKWSNIYLEPCTAPAGSSYLLIDIGNLVGRSFILHTLFATSSKSTVFVNKHATFDSVSLLE